MNERWRAPLVAVAASIGLIGIYLAFGGASYDPATVADPCVARDQSILDEREAFELIALSSLDGAACELQVSREELTLALADEQATAAFAAEHRIDDDDVNDAVRAGLVRAVDDAAATGRIDGVEETLLREVAERAPVGAAIEALQALPGDDSVQGLLLQLGDLTDVELPSLSDIPGADELQGLIP
jgi:hypothetical protein